MLPNHQFEALDNTYTLQRYPLKKDSDLRAWDAADHYLLKVISELDESLEGLCIMHDNFGALTLPLLQYQPTCYHDSWLSREAIYTNIASNNLDKNLRFISDIKELQNPLQSAQLIVGRIPKSKQQLAYLLQQFQQWAAQGTRLLLAGMDKHLSRGQYDLLATYFGPSQFYPGVKKARIWEAVLDKQIQSKVIRPTTLELETFKLSLSNQPNVFSQEKLDIGTRFFLENFSKLPVANDVADLACGNGILGLSYLRQHPQALLTFSDESFQAVQSCQENFKHNFPESKANIRADDGLKQAARAEFDLILCNPPFHHQHIVGTDIANALFKDAFRCLKKGGELWIVANRHLGYHVSLKQRFSNCSTEASNQKFVILKAVK